MAKKFKIELVIDARQAQSAGQAASQAMAGIQNAAQQAANAAQQAANQAGTAAKSAADKAKAEAERKAKELQRIEDRYAKAAYDAEVAYAKKKAEKAKADAEGKAKEIQRIEDRYLKAEYDARVTYEKKKAEAAQRATERATKAAEKEAEAALKRKSVTTKALTDEEVAAKVGNARIAADNKRRTQQAMQDANLQYIHVARKLTDEEIAFKVKNQAILNENDRRIRKAMEVAQVEYKGNRNGWEGVDRLIGSVKTLALSYASLQTALTVLGAVGEATRAAADAQKQMTDEYIRYRDAQREGLDVAGKQVTTADVIKQAEFEAETGLTPEKAKKFNEAYLGSGQQYRQKFGGTAFDSFKVQAAKYAQATNIDSGVVADLAGTIAGSRDYAKEAKAKGTTADKLALADLHKTIAVLQAGKGDNATLGKQATMLGSFAMNPDETLGAFNDWGEMAIAGSVAAEVNPAESEVFVRNAIKAIRPKEKDKANELMAKAKVTPQDKFFRAYEKIAPIVLKEARDSKTDINQVLAGYGYDEREQKAMAAFINKGVGVDPAKGAIAQRREVAAEASAPGAAERKIAQAELNPEGAISHDKSAARLRLEEMKQGAERASVATLQLQAREQMTHDHEQTAGWGDYIYDQTGGRLDRMAGGLGSVEAREAERIKGIIERRAKAQGIKLPPGGLEGGGIFGGDVMNVVTPESRDAYVKRAEKAFREQGGNILEDLNKQQLDTLRRIDAAARRQPPLGVGVDSGQMR